MKKLMGVFVLTGSLALVIMASGLLLLGCQSSSQDEQVPVEEVEEVEEAEDQGRSLAEQNTLAREIFDDISSLDRYDLEEIEMLYLQLIEEAPDTVEAELSYWYLSNMYIQAYSPSRYADAARLLEQYQQQYPDSSLLERHFPTFAKEGITLVENRLLRLYLETEEWEKQAAIYDRIIPDPAAPDPHMVEELFLYAEAMKNVGRNEEAILGYQSYLRYKEDIMPFIKELAQEKLMELGADPVPEDELADAR